MKLPVGIYQNRISESGELLPWNSKTVHDSVTTDDMSINIRTTERALESSSLIPANMTLADIVDENGQSPKIKVLEKLEEEAKERSLVVMSGNFTTVHFIKMIM